MDANAGNRDNTGGDQPKSFGRFRVIAPLARGGMGIVYLVEDTDGRNAVVKTIRRELAADPLYRARFRSEAQAALRFRSSLVAQVLEVDPNAEIPWIALEKIDGPTLREVVLEGNPMERARLSAFAADLAEGVHAFYDQGMAHGDLTPSNVVVQPGDLLKILDLGLSRPTADEAVTDDLPAMGTPYWLAPEVAAGFAPDSLSDVNQWGKLVLFAGTGYPRFGPASLREALSEIAPPLRSIVERSMSAVPDARPSPEELWTRTRVRRLSGTAPPTLSLVKPWLTLEPGDCVETEAVVTNMSAVEESYRLDLLGDLATSGHVEPSHLKLSAGDDGYVQVRYSLPEDSPVPPGGRPFAVRCIAEGDERRMAVSEGTISVAETGKIHLEVSEASARGRWIGRYAFDVGNRGNTPVQVRIDAGEQGDHLSFAVSPTLLDLSPGQVAPARVKVRVRTPFLAGEPTERKFHISATSGSSKGGPARQTRKTLEAAFEQAPVLSRRARWVVVVLVLVVLLVAGLAVVVGHLNAGS